MAIIQDGVNAGTLASVDARSKSLRVNNRPMLSATLGEYSCALRGTNVAASAAGSVWWAFRYGGANLCVITKVIFDGAGVSTALTAGQAVAWGLFVARSFTVSANTGATAATLTGNNCKLRTSYATTGVSAIGISNGANITGNTRTPDAQPMGSVVGGLVGLGTFVSEAALFDAYSVGHPIVLAQNEGVEVQNLITFPAAGVVNFGVTVHWSELTAAEWES